MKRAALLLLATLWESVRFVDGEEIFNPCFSSLSIQALRRGKDEDENDRPRCSANRVKFGIPGQLMSGGGATVNYYTSIESTRMRVGKSL